MSRLWHTWLPQELQPVVPQEAERFSLAVDAFEKDVKAALVPGSHLRPELCGAVVSWIPVLNNFLPERTPYPTEVLNKLASLLLEVVLNTNQDVELQVRAAETLASLLRMYRKDLTIQIPWKPLYLLLRLHFLDAVPKLDGLTLAQTKLHSIGKVVRRSRRFFPPGAAAEVWAEFSPDLSVQRAGLCFEAIGWLLLFFPSQELSKTGDLQGLDCQSLLEQWLGLWDSIVHSHFWNCHWMHMFAKLAKHDVSGKLPWQHHHDRIFTYILWVYQVPVGTATSSTPIHETANGMGKYLFSSQANGLSRNAGKLIVYLLRDQPDSSPAAQQGPDGPAISTIVHLESLVDLLHQYYHPSNGGSWTTDLTKLMHSMVKHCMKQLSNQGSKPNTGNRRLLPSIQERFVDCVVTLASMAQFSKHESLSHSAVKALSQLAYISPSKVLPLVAHRFQTALETATATHQLVASIQTLAACVRPMLLSASPQLQMTDAGEGPAEVLAQAMMALLPGIDANDEAKTVAVLSFYRAVLSSLPYIPDPEDSSMDQDGTSPLLILPVYWEEWLDELVSRFLALLENLDAGPGHHAADHASNHQHAATFLIGSGDMTYSTFLGLLFAKLPPRLGTLLVKRVADFALGATLLGVSREAAVFVNAAATHYAALTEKLMVRPLMQRLLEECPEPGLQHLSSNLEGTIRWHSNLLRESLYPLTADTILALLPDLLPVVNKLLAVNSRLIQIGGGTLLGTIILSLVRYRLPEPTSSPLRVGPGLEGWVDKTGSGVAYPEWSVPQQRHLEAAEQLQQEYLFGGCEELQRLCGGGEAGAETSQPMFKQQVQACLSKIRGMLVGFMSRLRDFDLPAGPGSPICVVGPAGGQLGAAGIRETVAAALIKGSSALRTRDPESLSMLISAMGILLCSGNVEYNAWVKARSDQRRIASSMMEPAAATYLLPAGTEWSKRWPLWVVLDEVRMALLWRSSQAAFRNFATTGRHIVADAMQLPPAYRNLLSELVVLSTHQYRSVRLEAQVTVECCCKRYTGLAELLVPKYLAALSTGSLPDPSTPTPQLAAAITQAMDTAAAEAGSGMAKDSVEGKTESEQDGLVLGSSNVLNSCITMRRLLFRSPDYFRMLLQALMASRQYTSNASQAGVNELLLGICGRLKLPPTLLYSSPEFEALATQFLALSKPSSQAARWRHTLLANIFALFLMPPLDSPLAVAFTRHFLDLFMCDVLLLKQVAGTGLFFQLLSIVDHGQHNSEVVAAVEAAMAGNPQFVPALLKHMANGHTSLDLHESNKDKRSASSLSISSTLLNMTFEQIITRVVTALASRHYVWPEGADMPASWAEGWFEVGFAAFVRMLGCVAPGTALAAFQQPLGELAERVVVANSGSDKAEQCTCAEAVAGLLASGALWQEAGAGSGAAGGSGTSGSTGHWLTTLLERGFKHAPAELTDSWAFAVRFALRGMLDSGCGRQVVPSTTAATVAAAAEAAALAAKPPAAALPVAGASGAATAAAQVPTGLAARRRLWCSCGLDTASAREAVSLLLGIVTSFTASGDGQLLAKQKRLKLITQCVGELRQTGALSNEGIMPHLLSFWTTLIQELEELSSGDLYSIREHLGGLLVDVADLFKVPGTLPAYTMPVGDEPALQDATSESGPTPMDIPDTATLGPSISLTTWANTDSPLQEQAQQLCQRVLARFYSAVASLQALKNSDDNAASPTSSGTGTDAAAAAAAAGAAAAAAGTAAAPGASGASSGAAPSGLGGATIAGRSGGKSRSSGGASSSSSSSQVQIAQAGFGLQFMYRALRKGHAAHIRPLLPAFLPGLMQLQDLAGPQVQHLALEAKSSFVLFKYVPLLPVHVPVAVHTILQAAGNRSWNTRAAALVYLQYFWFRHRFLLASPDARRLEDFVVGRLQDEKAEVRGIAAATLSGMLKAIPPEHAAALRTLFVSRAKAVLRRPRGARRGGAAAAASADPAQPALLERQACVQGLKAFVIAHPYDCPSWMPEVLLALAGGANDPSAQVRSDIHKALAEFKRTHEQESIEQLKGMMDSDQWDSINQLTSQASYFT